MLNNLIIFVLAAFVGTEILTKVPQTLHTPLMSGANAISGITIVGALVAAEVSAEERRRERRRARRRARERDRDGDGERGSDLGSEPRGDRAHEPER